MFAIAIKSHARAGLLQSKTLALLEGYGVDLGLVHVFVSGAEQEAAYMVALASRRIRIVRVDESGPMAAVSAIQRYFPTGSHVLHMDDDIASLSVLDGRQLRPLEDFAALCERGFGLCARAFTDLWGIYPVHNAYFMRRTVTLDLRFIWAGCYGFVSQGIAAEPPTVHYKDDFERSIRSYQKHGAVVRFNHIAARTVGFLTRRGGTGADGAHDLRLRKHVADARYLAGRYPQYCYTVKKRGFGGLDLRLRARP